MARRWAPSACCTRRCSSSTRGPTSSPRGSPRARRVDERDTEYSSTLRDGRRPGGRPADFTADGRRLHRRARRRSGRRFSNVWTALDSDRRGRRPHRVVHVLRPAPTGEWDELHLQQPDRARSTSGSRPANGARHLTDTQRERRRLRPLQVPQPRRQPDGLGARTTTGGAPTALEPRRQAEVHRRPRQRSQRAWPSAWSSRAVSTCATTSCRASRSSSTGDFTSRPSIPEPPYMLAGEHGVAGPEHDEGAARRPAFRKAIATARSTSRTSSQRRTATSCAGEPDRPAAGRGTSSSTPTWSTSSAATFDTRLRRKEILADAG